MISIKVHKSCRGVVGICDSNLIGKTFEEDKYQLDAKENFFKGDEFNEEEAINIMRDLLREDATFNIIGPESVNAALKAKIIDETGVGKIKEIPFALILL